MSYQTEIQGILAWVDLGCRRLMTAGGGPISREYNDAQRPRRPRLSATVAEQIVELAAPRCMSAVDIARALGICPKQVRHVVYHRGIKLPDQRGAENRRRVAQSVPAQGGIGG